MNAAPQPVTDSLSASPSATSSTHPWLRQAWPRLAAHWRLKLVGIPAFVTVFFAAYFQLLHHPVFPVTLVPLIGVDRVIGFHPAAMLPYASLWLYVFLVPALLRGRRELLAFFAAVTSVAAIGLGTFLFWPTAVPPAGIDWSLYPSFGFLKDIDAAGNACPSLHAAFAVLTAVWLERFLRQMGAPTGVRLFNGAWAAAIVYSTLATRQHVAVDALAGITLGLTGALFFPRQAANRLEPVSHPVLHRQGLALAVSAGAKLTLFTLGFDTLHPAIAAGLFFAPDFWILRGLLIPNSSELMPVVTRFVTPRKEVWLTIDDGPDAATTRPMLDLLDRHNARATFFLIGATVAAEPELVREILQRGHTLGNHTFTHPLATFWLAGPSRTAREVDSSQAALVAAGAEPVLWFRAPAGIKTFFLRRVLDQRQKVLVGWTGRGREIFSTSLRRPLARLSRAIRPGAILLVHESARHGAKRIALLAALLDHLSAKGYACVLPPRRDLV